MKLISLNINNFMPYYGETLISFPQEEYKNVMLIYGDNMRGKTSFLNAIRWAFYGVSLGRHLRVIPINELLNKEASAAKEYIFSVSIKFDADGDRYELKRVAKKKDFVSDPRRPDDFEISLNLLKNGTAITADHIEFEINKFAPEQVSRFFLFDGELLQEYETLLIEGSEQGKKIKEAIEQVLGVPTLINGRDELSTLLKKYQKQQNKDLSSMIGQEKQAEKNAEWLEKKDSLEVDLNTLREQYQNIKNSRIELSDELDKLDSVYKIKAKIDSLKTSVSRNDDARNELINKKSSLTKHVWKDFLKSRLSEYRNDLQNKLDLAFEDQKRFHSIQEHINYLNRLIVDANCPTCGQPVTGIDIESIKKQIIESELLLKSCKFDLNSVSIISSQIRDIEPLLSANNLAIIQDIENQINKISVEITRDENLIEEHETEISGFDTDEISRKRLRRDQLLREEGRIEADIEEQKSKLEMVKKEIDIIQKIIQNNPSVKNNLSTKLVDYTESLEKAFEKGIHNLRDKLKNKVAQESTKAFLDLTTQKKYKKLEINENYGLTIIDDTNSPVTVRSSGAEQVVALALINGLSKSGRPAGPIVMDTPFGRLDLKHRTNILRYLPNSAGQLVLLVHDGEIRKDIDLKPIADRIGITYEILEVNPRHSKIVRA